MKMHRVFFFFTFCLAIIIATAKGSSSSRENTEELVDPVDDEVDETEEEDPSPRPIRASAAALGTAATPRRRRLRGRKNGGGGPGPGGGIVQRRRLQPNAFRPTRAPLFEASPPDPYMTNGIVGPTGHYGHSHSPPTRNPYYSPSKFERDRKRQRIKLASEAPLHPLPQNSFDDPGPAVLNNPGFQSGKKYAFAYAVGDDSEDFSHKQAKDGPITIGEYRITLPDGRTQVVRYSAGGKHGYKADVTYEAGEQQQPLGAAGSPAFRQHHNNQQYHEPVQPTHHLTATPASSFNSNRVIKSRPLKAVALHHQRDVEYSPPSSSQSHDVDEYHAHTPPHPSPKIRLKAGGNILPRPTPTAEYLNGISSTTPTPRPNSIYDKISPYRGGKYSGSEELAYAHEHSPRAGPSRATSKSKHTIAKQVSTNNGDQFYDSPSPSPYPHKPTVLTAAPTPTKKYRAPPAQYQANHVNEYNIRPQKHFQFLQETPIHNHPHHHLAKPVKQQEQHLVPLDHYKAGPLQVSYEPVVHHKPKKSKKNKHGIHNPLGQYLLPAQVTAQTPASFQSTSPGPFHYYNSFHSPHHHSFGQISSPSPTPVTSVSHSESPFPNAYPVTAYPDAGPSGHSNHQPRMRFPSTPSTGGHAYLETPASGERPNRLGIKEALSRLPSRDLPTPKTTIHPYEVGAVDYGKGVAYGNSPHDNSHYGNFGGLDNLDHTNALFNSVTSPATTGFGEHPGYFPHDVSHQFDFLNGLGNFDVEQANVREIRQPRPTRVGGRLSRRVNRRPDKRRGVAAPTEEPTRVPEMIKPSSSSAPPPAGRQQRRQRKQPQSPPPHQRITPSQRPVRPSRQPPTSPSSPPTTSRTRGRRRRTQQPQPDPMIMHSVESRRPRTRSRQNNNNNNNN